MPVSNPSNGGQQAQVQAQAQQQQHNDLAYSNDCSQSLLSSASSYRPAVAVIDFCSPPPRRAGTLWLGAVQPHWDENYVFSMFQGTGECVSVKLVRDKSTGLPSGYASLTPPRRFLARSA